MIAYLMLQNNSNYMNSGQAWELMPVIPPTWEVEIWRQRLGRLRLDVSPDKKSARLHLNQLKKLDTVVCPHNPSYAGGISRRMAVQASPSRKHLQK
jgi:hypothetical protein